MESNKQRNRKKRLSRALSTNPVNIDNINDDELERSILRNEAKTNSILNNSLSQDLDQGNVDITEITSHLDTCMKLFMENKITQKNSWQLKVIDFITSLVQKDTVPSDILKIATTSLEVGGKIYGLRVDDIYDMGLEIASNMARAAAHKANKGDAPEVNGENEGAGIEELNATNASKQRKKRTFKLCDGYDSLAEDVNSLLGPVELLATECYGASDTQNHVLTKLLTHKIPMNSACTSFLFLNKEPAYVELTEESCYKNELSFSFDFEVGESLHLCVPFEDFKFLDWDPDREIGQEEESIHIERDDDIVFDNQGFPIHELDGSILESPKGNADNLDDNNSNSSHAELEQVCEIGRPVVEYIRTLRPGDGDAPNEYLYRTAPSDDIEIDRLWAGPDHWKLKHIRNNSHEVVLAKQKKRKTRAKVLPSKPIIQATILDQDDQPKQVRSLKLKKKIARMPINYCIKTSSCFQLMSTNAFINEIQNNQEEDANEPDYNYENGNDSQFCVDENEAGPIEKALEDLDEMSADHNANFDDIEAPETVPKSTMAFATKAKRMNMKKLKCAVWDSISGQNTYNEPEANASRLAPISETANFKEMYKNLPYKINQSMKDSLSAPLAFVALLHLANENNLKLEANELLDDITISQDKKV